MSILTFIAVVACAIVVSSAQAAEKLRVANPAIAPGSTPAWVTADKGLWRKYGFDVEPILVSGGARAVPALIGNSLQFLVGSDTAMIDQLAQQLPARIAA